MNDNNYIYPKSIGFNSISDLGLPSRKILLAKWIGYFALVDLLIFPYFQVMIIPYSLPLIVIGFILLGAKLKPDNHLKLYLVILGTVIFSLIISIFWEPYSNYIIKNIKHALQFLTSFFYFFYFINLTKKIQLNIRPILFVFIIWFALLGIMFINDPINTNELISKIYGRLINSEENLLKDFRYCYIFSDPNTGIYFFLVAISPVIMFAEKSSHTIFIFILGAIMVVLSQSSGGAISYCLMLIAFLLSKKNTFSLSIKTIGMCLVSILIISGLYLFFMNSANNFLIELAINRLLGDSDRYAEGGGRFYHWAFIYNNFSILPFGRGYTLYHNGQIRPPHSDFVGMIYRYGFVSLVPSLLFFFRTYKITGLLLIPALITFLVNSLLDEQKLFALFLSLLAIVISTKK